MNNNRKRKLARAKLKKLKMGIRSMTAPPTTPHESYVKYKRTKDKDFLYPVKEY